MTKKERMYEKIKNHGEELKKLFSLDQNIDPVKLCKDLFTIENALYRSFEKECNENLSKYDNIFRSKYLSRLDKVCNKYGINRNIIFINPDPRGYTLKIKEQNSKNFYFKDWGGNGIIAPDFKEEA